MSLLTANVWWRFGGFTLAKNKTWTPIEIPRIKMTSQDIFNSAIEEYPPILNPGTAMDAVINVLPPDYPEEDDLLPVINNGFRSNDDSDRDVFLNKISAIDRFRNPRQTNPETLDCATCHFADASRYYIGTRFADLKGVSSPFIFANPNNKIFNLENSTIATSATRIVRAFGYFGDQPAVNQRAINDSAESAHWLNQNGF